MIEIAISLAVIGFALVAIIGILPSAMQVQKQNRQETIVNQDATVLLGAIRSGAQGMDDLTNYIVAITNSATLIQLSASGASKVPPQIYGIYGYTYFGSSVNGSPGASQFPLTNGLRVVGLLSTPKYIAFPSNKGGQGSLSFISNHVVAYVRSVSGNAAEKGAANYSASQNPVQDLAFNIGFSYRLISDVVPYFAYDPNGVLLGQPGSPAGAPGLGTNYSKFTENLQTNMHDLRLTFRWPLLPSGDAGPGRQVFRAPAAGLLIWTNQYLPADSWPAPLSLATADMATTLFFFQPRTYLQVQTP